MQTRGFIIRIILTLAILPILWGCQSPSDDEAGRVEQDPNQRFNVLLIVSDALRYDQLGCNGGPSHTPNLDRLAQEGAVFHQAFAAAPWTTPAAISLITGRPASVFLTARDNKFVKGGSAYQVPTNLATLPGVLRKAGYTLALNAHNPNSWIAGNFSSFTRVEVVAPGPGLRNADPKLVAMLPRIMDFDRESQAHRNLVGLFDFLAKAPAETPFFAVNWIDDPHSPYHPDSRFLATVPVPTTGLDRPRDFYLSQVKMYVFEHFDPLSLTPQEIQYFRDLYRAEVESVDERVGLILEMLAYRKQLANTIIVFTADHGEEFHEHGGFGHGRSFYQELLHVPLIIRGPGVPAGVEVEQVVSTLDLMATLKGLLGLSQWRAEDGSGFLAAFTNENPVPKPLFFGSATHIGANDCRDAVRDGRLKLITHTDEAGTELYDLAADPGETRNLVAERFGEVERLTGLLVEHRRECLGEQSAITRMLAAETDTADSQEKSRILKKLKSLGYVN